MIHILDHINPELRHNDHWRTIVPDLLSSNGYDVGVIQGTPIVRRDSGLIGEAYYKTSQFGHVYDLVLTNGITTGDTIIISDAWNVTALALRYISDIENLNLKIIGYWRDGIFDVNSRIWKRTARKSRRWSTALERTLCYVYDYNCFFSAVQSHKFKGRYRYKDSPTIVDMGLPYGSIRRIRDTYDRVDRENIIIIPHNTYDEDQYSIYEALKTDFPQYEFVMCSDYRLTRSEYYELLNRAKATMAINLSETDPTNIYEGMVFGCVPIVPDRLVYAEVFPGEYQYPSYYTQPPRLNFVRGRDHMHNVIRQAMEDYDSLSSSVERYSIDIESKYFTDQLLLNIVKECV